MLARQDKIKLIYFHGRAPFPDLGYSLADGPSSRFFRCNAAEQAFITHPALVDGAVTEDELALFGSVVAEVDRWYTR